MKPKKVLTFKESPYGLQLHAGKQKGIGDSVWHSGDHKEYWCGDWGKRSAQELFDECRTIMIDLLLNHPELKK